MKIIISPRAKEDLGNIKFDIEQNNPRAAIKTISRIRNIILHTLSVFPELGRPWENGPTRALSIAGLPYRIHYSVHNDSIEIITIWHTSRMPPSL